MLDGPMIRRPLRRARVTSAGTSTSLPSTEVSVDLVVSGIDGVDRDVDAVRDVAPDGVTDRAGPFRGADHGDGPWEQDAGDRPGVGALLPPLDAVEELVGVGQFPVEVDDSRVEPSLERPARFGEHGEHRPVVAEDLGGEPFDAVRAGDGGEVLEQERGDSGALVAVVDHERSLGFAATRPPFVARPGDEFVVRLDGKRSAVDHVDVGEMEQLLVAEFGFRREEATVDAVGRLSTVELGEGGPVVGCQRPDEDRVTVAEHDGGGPRRLGGGLGGR